MANYSNTYIEVHGKESKVREFIKKFKKGLNGDYWYDNSLEGREYSMECVYIDDSKTLVTISGSGRWSGPDMLIQEWGKQIGKGLIIHYIDYEYGESFYYEFIMKDGEIMKERSTTTESPEFFMWLDENGYDVVSELEWITDDLFSLIGAPHLVNSLKVSGFWDKFIKTFDLYNDTDLKFVEKMLSVLNKHKNEILKLCDLVKDFDNKSIVADKVIKIIYKDIDLSKHNIDINDIMYELYMFVYITCQENKKGVL